MSPIPWSFSYTFPSYDNVSDISGGHSLGFGGVFGGFGPSAKGIFIILHILY